MTRTILLIAATLGLSACSNVAAPSQPTVATGQPEAVDPATVDFLAQTYTFGVAEAPLGGCRVSLAATPVLQTSGLRVRRVEINSACRENFPVLSGVSYWAPTGGASLAFFGGEPLREISDFSPVQDGTGVYLRGGFEGDAKVYELRTPGG